MFLEPQDFEDLALKAENGSSMRRAGLVSHTKERASNPNKLLWKIRICQPPPLYRQAPMSLCKSAHVSANTTPNAAPAVSPRCRREAPAALWNP